MKLNNNTVTRQDLAQAVYREIGLSKAESSALVDSVISTISDTLSKGDNVKLAGFGNFTLREKKARIGRNPKTGTPAVIGSRRVMTFKPSPKMIDRVNSALTKRSQYGRSKAAQDKKVEL